MATCYDCKRTDRQDKTDLWQYETVKVPCDRCDRDYSHRLRHSRE